MRADEKTLIHFDEAAKCPLDGVRVLDLSRLVAGNMLSLQLADFGAEVIKIETPGDGDPLRAWRVEGVSLYWKVYARNKKSVTLSLREAQGPEFLAPLPLADMIAGFYGSPAVLVALREVEVNGGAGQVIDLPLLDPIFSILGPEAAIFRLTGEIKPRSGSRSMTASPRNVFETRDGR